MRQLVTLLALLAAAVLAAQDGYARSATGNIDSSIAIERVTVSNDGKLYVWDKEGKQLAGWPKDLSAQKRIFLYGPRLLDIDIDQQAEVVAVSEDKDGGDLKLHVFKGNGAELASWSFELPDDDIVETPLISDINRDSSPEIIYSTTSGVVKVFRRDFKSISEFKKTLDTIPHLNCGDVDNDGMDQLYAASSNKVYVWDEFGNMTEFYSLPDGEEIIGNIVIRDITRDDYPEIIFSTTKGRILSINKNGVLVMDNKLPSGINIISGVIVDDIDVDKFPEIIVATDKGALLAFEVTGEAVASWRYDLGYREPSPINGVVANDIYRGLFSSNTGWDQNVIYRTNHNRYSRIRLGENVREWDTFANFDFIEMIEIFDVFSFPKPFTPNGDGVNDNTIIHYWLSDEALVALDLYDSHEHFISRIKEKELKPAGEHTDTWSGVDTRGTVTENDDASLETGLYIIKIVAESKDGFVSIAKVSAIVNGIKAEIEIPKDDNEEDDIYPKVFGEVSLSGIAVDPNFGEDNLDADFQSYKLYYRPGVWDVTAEDAANVGKAGSSWLPLIVPLQHQCSANNFNEPNDALYPVSNVSCRPVQHGALGIFDATDTEKIPNSEYTLLLKVMDSNGNTPDKLSYDTLVVTIANAKPTDPYDASDPYDINNPNNPKYKGPDIVNAAITNTNIDQNNSTTTISYSLENETSNVHITIFQYNSGVYGPAVAVYSFNDQAPNDAGNPKYSFTWDGKNTLDRNVSGGEYRIRIEAHAVDGTGVDIDDSLGLTVAKGFAATDILNITKFSATPAHFDPIGFGANLEAEKTFLSYELTKEAKVTTQVLVAAPGGGYVVQKVLTNGVIKKHDDGSEYWAGTGDNGLILPVGADYIVRLTAESIDVGNEAVITKDIAVHLDASSLNSGLVANITQLKGDDGEIVNEGDELSAMEGNPDFLWRAKGNGYIEMPFDYTIGAKGKETYYIYTSKSVSDKTVICEDAEIGGGGGGGGGGVNPKIPVVNLNVSLGSGYSVDEFGIMTNGAEANIQNKSFSSGVESFQIPPAMEHIAPFGGKSLKSGNSISFTAQSAVPIGPGILDKCVMTGNDPGYQKDIWLTICNKCHLYTGDNYCTPGYPPSGTVVYDCGTVTAYADGKKLTSRDWGPDSSSGSYSITSTVNNPSNNFAQYTGQVGSGQADTISASISSYGLTTSNKINGITSSGSSGGSTITLPGLQTWLTDGKISASVYSANAYNTDQHDPYLSSAPYKKIWGNYKDFNEEYYHATTDNINIYNGYKTNIFNGNPGRNLYSFSDVVRLTNWDLDIRYPNVSISEPDGDNAWDVFKVDQLSVTPAGVKGTQNSNIDDYFRLRLLPEAAPKKFVEIWGSAGANYELYYYDASKATPKWYSIESRTSNPVSNGILAHWDVTRLNGENYTVVLKTKSGGNVNIDKFDIGIGTKVDTSTLGQNDFVRVYTPFKRASLVFGAGALPNGSELVTINSVKPGEADFKLPTGIAPLGPIFDIKPDDIKIDPDHHVQLEITYTPSELKDAFGVADASELTIYNLAGDEAIDGLATVVTFDNMDDDDPNNDVWRFTASLEHFSQYFLAKKIAGYFYIESPTSDRSISGLINIIGRVEVEPRPVDAPDVPKPLASITSLEISYYPEGNPSSKTNIYSKSEANSTTAFSQMSIEWDVSGLNGNYILRFDAKGPQGATATYDLPVAIDNTPAQSSLIINGKAVADGGTVYSASGVVIEIKTSDSASSGWQSGVKYIEYAVDGGEYVKYEQPFNLFLETGTHTIVYHAVDNNNNLESDKSASVIIQEKMSDEESSGIVLNLVTEGPKHNPANQTWVNDETIFSITSAGGAIDHIKYRVDGSEYQVYGESFSIQSGEEGLYIIEYFAVDQLGLRSPIQTREMLLDISPPASSMSIDGLYQESGGKLIVTPETKLSLNAVEAGDPPSGLDRIEYKISDDVWQIYKEPLSVDNDVMLLYRAVDHLGNTEEAHTVNIKIDDVAPSLSVISAPSVISPNDDGRHDTVEFVLKVIDNVYNKLYLDAVLKDQNGVVYKVFEKMELQPGENKLIWDGKIDGDILTEGIYSYDIVVLDAGQNQSGAYNGTLVYDLTPPEVNVLNGIVKTFSPNGDELLDVLQVDYTVSDNLFSKDIFVELLISSQGEFEILKGHDTVSTPPLEHTLSWNGTNAAENGVFDGNYVFQVMAEDPAGNRSNHADGSAEALGEVFVDRQPPETELSIEGKGHDDGEILWGGAASLVRLEAKDPTPASGVSKTVYSFDGGAENEYKLPFGIPKEDVTYKISYHAVDAIGNIEKTKDKNIRSDVSPPATSIEIGTPQEKDEKGNLYISPNSAVELASEDGAGIGVEDVYFEIKGVKEPSEYSTEINLKGLGDGYYDLLYWSKDHLDNEENKHSHEIMLDGTPPVTDIVIGEQSVVDKDNSATYITSKTPISFAAVTERNDLDKTEYRINDGDWLPADTFSLGTEGEYNISFRSYDRLGNVEATKTSKIIVDNTPPAPTLELSQNGGGSINYVTGATLISIGGIDANSKLAGVEYSIDGGPFVTYTGPFSLNELAAGTHVINFRAYDRLGNVSEGKTYVVQLIDIVIERTTSQIPRILAFMLQTHDIRTEDPKPNEQLMQVIKNEIGGYVTIINGDHRDPATVEKFIAEMRSDKYTTYVLATDAYTVKFYDSAKIIDMLKELKARVYKGDALVLLTGYSDITDQPWIDFVSDFAGDTQNNIADVFGGREKDVGLIVSNYGRGTVANFGADLGRMAFGGGPDYSTITSGLAMVMREIMPKEEELDAGEVVDITYEFKNSGDLSVAVKAVESFPEGWIETRSTIGEVPVISRNFDLTIPANDSVKVDYLYRPKASIGDYNFKTNINAQWSDNLVSSAELIAPYSIKNDIFSLIDRAMIYNLPDISDRLLMVKKRLLLGAGTIGTDNDINEMIGLVLEAIDLAGSPDVRYQLCEIVESLGAMQAVKSLEADVSVGLGDPNDPSSYHGDTSSDLGSGGGCQLIR